MYEGDKMKEKIITELSKARAALGNVYVHEEQNCFNLGGAMQILREAIALLEQCEVVPPTDEKSERS